MADREKRVEDGNTKIWISREQKELFRWNKNNFWRVIIWWKNKNLMKIVDTSLNDICSRKYLKYVCVKAVCCVRFHEQPMKILAFMINAI